MLSALSYLQNLRSWDICENSQHYHLAGMKIPEEYFIGSMQRSSEILMFLLRECE